MMKKLIIGIAIILALFTTGFGVYFMGSPEVVIMNHSSQYISEVIVKLPSNRIVFGAIAPKADSTIFYSWSQADGVYEYQISFANGVTQDGKCGYVTHHQIGKRLLLRVKADLNVICNETSKV
jgi:hypothetical protein